MIDTTTAVKRPIIKTLPPRYQLPEPKNELGVATGVEPPRDDQEEEWETVDERTVLLDYSKI